MKVETRTPAATLLLIAANIAAAFVMFLQPDLLGRFGFVASAPGPLTALTSLFLHVNLLHLLGNMVFLAAAGPATEMAMGAFRFFGVYLAGGLAGVAAHWLLAGAKDVPLVGASGAVAACVALGAVRFYRSKVLLAPSVSVPLFAIVALWLGLQLAGGMVTIGEETAGTSYWAHVGGAVAGLLLALAFKAPQEADRRESERVMNEMQARGPAAQLAAAERHLESHPKDLGALLQKAEANVQLGDRSLAAQTFLEALQVAPGARTAEVVALAAAGNCVDTFPGSTRVHLAERVRPVDTRLATMLLESVLSQGAAEPARPDALLGLADLKRDSHPDEAANLIQELIQSHPLHPAAEIARTKGWLP